MAGQNTPKTAQDAQNAEGQAMGAQQDAQNAEALGEGGSSKEKPLTPDLDAAINAEVVREERLAVQQLRGQKKVRILIASGRDAADRAPVEVGVNGQHYLIERDKEVLVPEAVVNVLRLAMENVPTMDGHGRVAAFVPTMRYPVTVLGEA